MSVALADEPTIVGRILDHIDHKTTDVSAGIWREPTLHYTSPARFESEIARVLRRTPTPFCPSAALPDVGCYVARTAALTPIVAVRSQDGRVRAFRNACRHRGAQLVAGSGCKQALTCPYHAWTWSLDGRLRGVPHEHGFPGLDKDDYGLVPLTTIEKHGMVFVTQDDSAANPEEDVIPDLFGPEYRLFSTIEQDVPANWKIVTEGVLEGYHLRSTHRETFAPRQYDNINVVEVFGRNCRISYPYRTIEALRDVPPERRTTAGAMTLVYHLFPNVSVATFPAHRVLAVFEPLAIDRTRIISYILTDQAGAQADAMVTKGTDFVSRGSEEDRAVQSAVQCGLAAAANQFFTFGLFEGAIRHLHMNLAAALAGD